MEQSKNKNNYGLALTHVNSISNYRKLIKINEDYSQLDIL